MPYSRANGVDIWYETAGDGPALVFAHANPFDHDLWMYQSAHFSTWFRVVNIDLRAYGRSVKMTTPYALKDLCDDVVGVMKDAGVARVIYAGCSIGVSIGILLGLDHPEMFDALILVGGGSSASGRFQTRIDGYTSDLRGYHPKHMRDLVRPEFAQGKLGAYLLGNFAERDFRLDGQAIAQTFRAGNGTDTTARLPTMKVPVLAINGEFDNARPTTERTAALIPGAVHKILPNTGHACCLEDPAGFDALVIEFLTARGLMPGELA